MMLLAKSAPAAPDSANEGISYRYAKLDLIDIFCMSPLNIVAIQSGKAQGNPSVYFIVYLTVYPPPFFPLSLAGRDQSTRFSSQRQPLSGL